MRERTSKSVHRIATSWQRDGGYRLMVLVVLVVLVAAEVTVDLLVVLSAAVFVVDT